MTFRQRSDQGAVHEPARFGPASYRRKAMSAGTDSGRSVQTRWQVSQRLVECWFERDPRLFTGPASAPRRCVRS